MANSDMAGQSRVMAKERNNRRSPSGTGPGTKTPRKSGASKGFASNRTKGNAIAGSKRA